VPSIDAAFYLAAKARAAGGKIHVDQARAGIVAQAIPDPVVASQIARGLGRSDQIVGGDRIGGVGQRYLDEGGAEFS